MIYKLWNTLVGGGNVFKFPFDNRTWCFCKLQLYDSYVFIFSQQYENQVSILGSWTDGSLTMTRPKFSDVQGKVRKKENSFSLYYKESM